MSGNCFIMYRKAPVSVVNCVSNCGSTATGIGGTTLKKWPSTRHVSGGLRALQDSKIRDFDHFGKKMARHKPECLIGCATSGHRPPIAHAGGSVHTEMKPIV